jgi:hypothetical protein
VTDSAFASSPIAPFGSVLDSLLGAQLLEKFDIVAVQEVLHREGLEELKKIMPGWDFVCSHDSVGRVRKEFYAFLYRSDRIKVLKARTVLGDCF